MVQRGMRHMRARMQGLVVRGQMSGHKHHHKAPELLLGQVLGEVVG